MTDQANAPGPGDISENDKLLAAVSYPLPIVAIVILLVEEMRVRPFQKYHAVQALAVNLVLWVVIAVLGAVLAALSFFLGGLCGLGSGLLWFVTLYWAYEAFQGKTFEIPFVTQFLKGQGWL